MWKRTRAIRKDITQQHLACKKTAHVLEVVCRYHIWCAHALAKEDRAVFDSKINNENMEKTMTSIEQVYQDLACRNLHSESEAEFRAYMVYLSLNETNVLMKHLSRVPPRFKKSEYICRARRVISAYLLGNYQMFWNEVRKATLLEASVLHRYFNQVTVPNYCTHCLTNHNARM